jgi:hypothetical protein
MLNRGDAGFRITGKKGFHVTFENGYTVSVQFGPGNYCDNHDLRIGRDDELAGRDGSTNAECAAWGLDGGMLSMGDDTVTNRSTPAEVLELMNRMATMPNDNEAKHE